MQVEQLDQDGSFVKTNPMVYLSDIARKGDIGLTLTDSKDDSVLYCYNAGQAGQDVAGSDLAQKDGEVTQGDWLSRLSGSSDPKEWLQILLSRDGDAGHGGDIISELIGALLSGLIAMAQLSQARDKDGEQETSDVMASDIVTIDARRDNSSVHRPSGREAIVAKAAGIAAASFDELSPQERSQGMSLSQS